MLLSDAYYFKVQILKSVRWRSPNQVW